MKTSYNRKDLDCKICGETVKNVGLEAEYVTCWKCVSDQLRGMPSPCQDDEEDDDIQEHEHEEED